MGCDRGYDRGLSGEFKGTSCNRILKSTLKCGPDAILRSFGEVM